MPFQPIRFYQTGSFVAGNRLLAPEQRSVQSTMGRSNTLTSGHRACQGCGEALGARYALDAAMRATNNRLIAANATGYAAFSLMPPNSSVLGVDYKINLLDPAAGERFIAIGRVLKPGRTLSVVECDIEAEDVGKRKLIAKMLTTMMCLEGIADEIRYKK